MILGVDIGGTFTDVVLVDRGSVSTAKISTSALQSDAIVEGLDRLAGGGSIDAFVHGTTVATNALLERTGARVVLITDEGFEDVIEIGRQDRPSLYDPFVDRPEPLVARSDRVGVRGVPETIDVGDAEAVAISFLDGHIEPAREAAAAARVAASSPMVAISRSSVVSPEFREFERTSTTVLNAYLSPITERYLRALEERLVGGGRVGSMAVMRSSGGLMSASDAVGLPAAVLLSGPAGGVVAAREFASALGIDHVISFDMGGTSTDVCRIVDGNIDVSYERSVDGYVCRMASAGIHTVGAGGGSVAWVDTGGALRVGPRSAGSNPGPACYRRGGTEATVTDANVVLGRIDQAAMLGGTLSIDAGAAERAVTSVAEQLGMSLTDVALGIVAIAEDVMAGAIRTVSIEQGSDPRGASLLAFGGAGGLHAASLARSLGMASVIVPPFGGVLSAVGLLLAPPRIDLTGAVLVTDGNLTPVQNAAEGLETSAKEALRLAGHEVVTMGLVLDVRYLGQAHEIGVPWERTESFDQVAERFNDMHELRNGFARPRDPVEIVAVRCTAGGEPGITMDDLGMWSRRSTNPPHTRELVGAGGPTLASIYDRLSLSVGDVIIGPAVIEEQEATTFLDVGERATVKLNGSLEVTW
ncbi:MAG: hydantoinase/oxoprolinase family protein [Acidimicrobiia bacterium]|nr:MAG: hydantoinase/oxoprolinase family protein [Acidimicrobiia bacterium]